jgi:hypothetical protein
VYVAHTCIHNTTIQQDTVNQCIYELNFDSLTFVMPNIRQFVYTALKTRLAAESLASKSISGLIDVFDIYRPKYLNYYTVSIFN